ncbi:MAG: hypothetical protein IAF38_13470 [Bacteroidia bacterium]|nr:hypothetical protein [Bacteroidia bacterium]
MRFYSEAVTAVGAYACVQNFYKFKSDLGIGLTVFGEYNKQRYLFGIRVELFFSGAFRGDKRRKIEN